MIPTLSSSEFIEIIAFLPGCNSNKTEKKKNIGNLQTVAWGQNWPCSRGYKFYIGLYGEKGLLDEAACKIL